LLDHRFKKKKKEKKKEKEKEKDKEKDRTKNKEALENVRVIQKNLVYVSSLPSKLLNETVTFLPLTNNLGLLHFF